MLSARCNLNMENHLHSLRYIYIYDHEHEFDYHMKPFMGLDASLLLELQQMIKDVDPYAYKYLQPAETSRESNR